MRRSTLTAAITVGLTVVAFLAWDLEFWANQVGWHRQRNHRIVRDVFAALRVGTPGDAAAVALSRASAGGFVLHGPCDPETCVFAAPSEFGAVNWQLWVQFSDGRVSAARVRTADSLEHHPDDAPADLGTWRAEN